MPTSNLYLAPEVVAMVGQVEHRHVLDVGPGWGKYAVLLREYLNDPPEQIDAVEAWEPYVNEHRLRKLYDRVFVGDVTGPLWSSLAHVGDPELVLAYVDVVLMVDVIEHIPKDRALDFLDRVGGRVVICTPVAWFDNDPGHEHPPTEEHVSHWTAEDWHALGSRVEVCYESLGGWLVRLGPRP